MAVQTGNQVLNLGTLIPISASALTADDDEPTHVRPGQYSFMYDDFGLRVFRYMRCVQSGGQLAGELASVPANVAISNITSGSTTSITDSAAAYTVDLYKWRLLVCTDNNDSAGAAPEGEVGVIVGNTATTISINPSRPFTAAAAVNDDFAIVSVFDAADSADGDIVNKVVGICVNGIATQYNWGWYQVYGVYPQARATTAAISANANIVADAAAVATAGSDAVQLIIGHAMAAIAADLASPFYTCVFINTWTTGYLGASIG